MAVVGTATTIEIRDDDPDYPALNFASYILGQSAKSRLMNRLRQKEGLSYGVGAFLQADNQDRRAGLVGYAMCATQNAEKAQDVMRDEIKMWISKGITEEELTDGIKGYSLKFDNNLANDRYVVRKLVSGLEIDRTFQFQAAMLEKTQTLTTADILRVLKKRLGDSAFAEVKVGDLEKAATP